MKHAVLCLALFAAVAAWSLPAAYADTSAKMTKEEKRAAKEAKKEEKRAAKEAKKYEREVKKAERDGDRDVREAEKEEAEAKKTEKKAVVKAAKNLKLIQSGKIAGSSKFLFYYHTNSALTMSEENIDILVEQAKKMKTAKIAVLLISHDVDDSNALKFYKEHKATNFPAVKAGEETLAEMPGYVANGSAPHVTIVDNTGKTIADGDGELIEKWKEYTIDADKDNDED